MANDKVSYVLKEIQNSKRNNEMFDESDLTFLDEYFQKYSKLIDANSSMNKYSNCDIINLEANLYPDVSRSVRKISKKNREASKLSHILKKTHFKAFVQCLKEISNGEHIPIPYEGELEDMEFEEAPKLKNNISESTEGSSEYSEEEEELEESEEVSEEEEGQINRPNHFESRIQMRHVTPQSQKRQLSQQNDELQVIGLHRDKKQPLGITVVKTKVEFRGMLLDRCAVERILVNSLIDKQGLLNVGDVIFEVNDQPVEDPDMLPKIISKTSGTLTFKILKQNNRPASKIVEKTYMKALFDYDPDIDPRLPAASIGLNFKAGEVFEVINRDDPNYWQALPLNSSNCQAYLIPSQSYQEKIISQKPNNMHNGFSTATRKKSKKAEILRIQDVTDISAEADLRTYEEVVKFKASRAPCLILTGADGLGKKTLKNMIVNEDRMRFAAPIRETSEARKKGEQTIYNHVNRQVMENDIREGLFVCVEEKNGELYGIRIQNIRELINQGKTAVIDCKPKDVYNLKTPIFNPFVALITAPSYTVLESLQKDGLQRRLTKNKRSNAELTQIFNESVYYENQYKYLIDVVIQQNGVQEAFREIIDQLNSWESNESWIPIGWEYDITFLPSYQKEGRRKSVKEDASPPQGVNSMQRRYEKKVATPSGTMNSRKNVRNVPEPKTTRYDDNDDYDDESTDEDEETDITESPKRMVTAKPVKYQQQQNAESTAPPPPQRAMQQQQSVEITTQRITQPQRQPSSEIAPQRMVHTQQSVEITTSQSQRQQQKQQQQVPPKIKQAPPPIADKPTKLKQTKQQEIKAAPIKRGPIRKSTTHDSSSGISETSSDED